MSHPGTAHPPDGSVRPHLALAERVHRIDGVINFRDIGGGITEDGRRIRTGRLYRSASLDAITDEGIGVFEALGLRRVIDLRSPAEVERHGRSNAGTMFGPALRVMADSDSQPLVFHCTSGKDRTGLLALLVRPYGRCRPDLGTRCIG